MPNTLWEYEAEFIRLIARIKDNGIRIDPNFCKPKVQQGEAVLREIRDRLGWNPGSSKQIGKVLLEDLGYPIVKYNKSGNPSFDKFAMEEYEEMLEADGSVLAKDIIRYRGWQKTVSSNYMAYLRLADRDNILHPNYKVHGTKTCRTSCEDPNLQQIPRSTPKEWNGDVKEAFIPRSDELILIEFDASQVEFRLQAAVAKELELLNAFNSGVDVFKMMAQRLGWERQDVKTLVYATGYGAGVKRISTIFGITMESAKARIEEFYASYPRLRIKNKQCAAIAKQKGYIEYWTGRRRHMRDKHHKAWNAVIQGGAFEIIKRCGIRVAQEIPYPIVLTVHDSYVFELPRGVAEDGVTIDRIKRILEAVPESREMGVKFKWEAKTWGKEELVLGS